MIAENGDEVDTPAQCEPAQKISLERNPFGEVLDVKVEQDALNDAGLPDINKVAPFIYAGEIQTYHRVGEEVGRAFEVGKGL